MDEPIPTMLMQAVMHALVRTCTYLILTLDSELSDAGALAGHG